MTDHERNVETELARYRSMTSVVSFGAGFADRVMARIDAPRPLSYELQLVFLRLAPLATAAALLLAAMNLRGAASTGQSFVDRVLGLPTVSLSNAYALEGDLANWGGVSR